MTSGRCNPIRCPTSGRTSTSAEGIRAQLHERADRVAVCLDDVDYDRDEVALSGGVDVKIVRHAGGLPDHARASRERRASRNYRLNWSTSCPPSEWQSVTETDLRVIAMEYRIGGVSWRPTYDMWVGADAD